MRENIGEIICENRQNHQMTQEEFASRLGVTPQAVSRWERGIGMPDISLVKGICKILKISANELLGIHENKVIEGNDLLMEQEIKMNMFAEALLIEFGAEVIPWIVEGLKTDYVNKKRKELVQKTGMLMPVLRLRDSVSLEPCQVRILSYDKLLWEKSYTRLDENSYYEIIDQTAKLCEQHYAMILNKQTVKIIIENLKEQYPGIAEGLVPERISYLQLLRHLQKILREKGSIRDMIHILEELEESLSAC